MADSGRLPPAAIELLSELQSTPYGFDFFQALRRLESIHPDLSRLGEGENPQLEPVRLGQAPNLCFAPSAVSSFETSEDGSAHRMGVAFFGLFGPKGPLPLSLTEYAMRRKLKPYDDPNLADFLNIFHHRALSLFYRAWASSRPCVSHDRPDKDRSARHVAALIGLAQPGPQELDPVARTFKLFFAGRFATKARSADGLEAVCSALLGAPAHVEQFVGEWVTIPPAYGWRLGVTARPGDPQLGELSRSALLGPEVYERQHKFRLVVGPVGRDEFRRLQPGGDRLAQLRALVRNYLGDELSWDLELRLEADVIGPLRLGDSARLGEAAYLIEAQDEIASAHIIDPLN